MKTQIYTTPSEIDASIIKGHLENSGIQSSIGPTADNFGIGRKILGQLTNYGIFVEQDKIEKAKEIIYRMKEEDKKDKGVLIKKKPKKLSNIIQGLLVITIGFILSFFLMVKTTELMETKYISTPNSDLVFIVLIPGAFMILFLIFIIAGVYVITKEN